MLKKGLTIGVIVEAQSANYGEGFANYTELKKISRGDGNAYTYISRQALRYNIIEQLGWDYTPVEPKGKGEQQVVQFSPDTTIKDYPEIDFFGYMKTNGKDNDTEENVDGTKTKKKGKAESAKTRSAAVRINNAISLEPFSSDTDYLTNAGLASRGNYNNSIVQSEIHKSFYAYTVSIDLDKVGIDNDIEIDNAEKTKRVKALLETIQFLYRDIKGRRENLSPVFIIGGIYDRKTPFFENRLHLHKGSLNIPILIDTIAPIKNDTEVGYVSDTFKNDEEIKITAAFLKTRQAEPYTVNEMVDSLCKKVEDYYNESN
jgi:CRISPR-associated protein Cst2